MSWQIADTIITAMAVIAIWLVVGARWCLHQMLNAVGDDDEDEDETVD
jgi:hypothetical protein